MRLGWLQLRGFRSYSALEWHPDPGVNILVGTNGAGKTNALEAISFLANLRSFRGAPEEMLIANDDETAVIRGEESSGNALVEVEVTRKGGRRVRVGQKSIGRNADVRTVLRTVAFLPDDLDLVKGSPAGRRELLDDVATQIWPASALDQAEFDRALRQRNTFLKQGDRDVATLEVWDTRLAQAAAKVMARRARAAATLEETLAESYGRIAGEETSVQFAYQSEWGGSLDPTTPTSEWASSLTAALRERRRLDFELRSTGSGPHRDDPAVTLSGRGSRHQASQGEQRTLALALRLATHRAVSKQTGRLPLLLLDDVYSELDPDRSKALTDALPEAQTFVSTTRLDEVPVPGKTWQVSEGSIR
ncbi:MAG: DNA replication/repair protein RecF [Acidimicrobiia bacterium]